MLCINLSLGSWIDESKRQTIETHCPLFRESPTNTILLFLSLSNSLVALNLTWQQHKIHALQTTMQKYKKSRIISYRTWAYLYERQCIFTSTYLENLFVVFWSTNKKHKSKTYYWRASPENNFSPKWYSRQKYYIHHFTDVWN